MPWCARSTPSSPPLPSAPSHESTRSGHPSVSPEPPNRLPLVSYFHPPPSPSVSPSFAPKCVALSLPRARPAPITPPVRSLLLHRGRAHALSALATPLTRP